MKTGHLATLNVQIPLMLYGNEKSNVVMREQWKKLLLQYCQLDTLAMVMVYLHWREYALA